MLNLERVERVGSGCLWITLLAFPVMMGIIFLGTVGLKGLAEAGWGNVGLAAGAVLLGTLLIGLLTAWASTRVKRSPQVRKLLGELQTRLGGTVSLPTLLHPIAAPRLKTSVDGRPAEIYLQRLTHRTRTAIFARLMEGEQARLGARAYSSSFRVWVKLDQPCTQTFGAMTRTRLSGLGAKQVGLTELSWGDPDLDQRFAAFSSVAPRGQALLDAEPSRQRLISVLSCNRPYMTRIDFGRNGASWMTVMSTTTTPEVIAEALEAVRTLVPEVG